jgi:hypothetical protein
MQYGWVRSPWCAPAALCAALALGCNDPLGPEDALDAQRRAWQAMHLEDYAYTLRIVCYCLDEVTTPVRVEVRDGAITTLTYVASGEPVAADYRSMFLDVDGLFARIRDALDQNADSLDARYHPTLHYPEHVWIDYDRQTADEEIGYEASELAGREGT